MGNDRLDNFVLAVSIDEIYLVGLKFPAHELTVHQSAYKKVFSGLKHPRNRTIHLLLSHFHDLSLVWRYLKCSDSVVHAGRKNIGLSSNNHEVYVINLSIVDFLTGYHAFSKHDHETRYLLILWVLDSTENCVW